MSEDDGEIDPTLDVKADIARERLRHVHGERSDDDLSNLLLRFDTSISDFYVPIVSLPVLVQPITSFQLSNFTEITHMTDGSNSNIYSALLGETRVVIKMIKKGVAHDQIALLEFDSEAELLCRINHPHIIKLIGRGVSPRKFLVLEYLSGGSLSSRQNLIQSSHGTTSPILRKPSYTYEQLLSLMNDVASAMSYLHTYHNGMGAVIIHRDLKPDNIGFNDAGELKLFDFGLSTVVRRTRSTSEVYEMSGNTGSLRYMAPEVVLNKPYNEKVDVYSYGIMCWQMASDRIPFKGISKDQFLNSIVIGNQRPRLDTSWPFGFRRLLEGCWHSDYERRPSFTFILDDINILIRTLRLDGQRRALDTSVDYVI